MLKRCLFYGLLFALSSIGSSLYFSEDTSAWSTNPLPLCTIDSDVLSWPWQNSVKDDYPDFEMSGGYVFYRGLGDTDTSQIQVAVVKSGNTPLSFMRLWYAPQDEFAFALRSQEGNYLGVITASTETVEPTGTDGSLSLKDASCMSYLANPTYTTEDDFSPTGYLYWTGIPSTAAWDSDEIDLPPIDDGDSGLTPVCEPWDFACYIQRITDDVGDFFGDIGDSLTALLNGIISGIAALFMPDPAVINIAWEQLSESFTSQLGFLLAPFDFLAKVAQHVIDDPFTSCVIDLSGTPIFAGSSIDPCKLDDQIPPLFSFIRIVLQAGTVLFLFTQFSNKYYEVTNK